MDFAGIKVPDTALVHDAIDLSRSLLEPFLFNHVMRSWLFGIVLAESAAIATDAELLAVAAILHDLGLTARYNGENRFEVDGANAAREFLTDGGIAAPQTQLVWDATAELEGQFKTVAYDARGWGKSDKTLAGYRLADLADEALSLVKALGVEQYVLVGHSMGGKVAQLAASRRPEGLSGLILVAPAQPTPRRNPGEMRQGQLHAYDNRENVLKTIGSGRLTARPPSPEILEQIVEDSMSGSHEATMAYPMKSILEDISAEVANINVPTVLRAGELDQVD